MYGKDVETWLKYLFDMREKCYNAAKVIIASTETQEGQRPKMIPHWHMWPTTIFETKPGGSGIQTESGGAGDDAHSHGISETHTHGIFVDKTSTEQTDGPENKIWEEENNCPISSFMPPIKIEYEKIKKELVNVRLIESKLYVTKDQMHDSIGSPYEELYKIEETYLDMEKYGNSHSNLSYIGEKMTMLFYLETLISRLTDAKNSLIILFDNIQRGYDSLVNGGKPSITWDQFDTR